MVHPVSCNTMFTGIGALIESVFPRVITVQFPWRHLSDTRLQQLSAIFFKPVTGFQMWILSSVQEGASWPPTATQSTNTEGFFPPQTATASEPSQEK